MKNKRQKNHLIRNTILGLLIVFFCMISAACTFSGVKGYRMYRETISEKTIEERVEEVRSMVQHEVITQEEAERIGKTETSG